MNGQKVWTSGAQWADRGMLLARTDRDMPKHRGLSFFIIDVDQPSIEIHPLHQMNGEHGFNEVFFTDAHIDGDRLVGEPGGGWSVAITVLGYERLMRGLVSVLPGRKAGHLDEPAGAAAARAVAQRLAARTGVSELVVDVAKKLGVTADPVLRQQLAALWTREAENGYLARRGMRDGGHPTPAGSLMKLARSAVTRAGRDTVMAVIGATGLLNSPDIPGGRRIQHLAPASPCASIAGGTDEIQRSIIGARVLGLLGSREQTGTCHSGT